MLSAILMGGGDFTKHFGQRLRAARNIRGLSQEELADVAGLHRTHISLIERDRRSVRLETLERLARALHMQPAELLPSITQFANARKARPSSRQRKTR